LEFEFRPISH